MFDKELILKEEFFKGINLNAKEIKLIWKLDRRFFRLLKLYYTLILYNAY